MSALGSEKVGHDSYDSPKTTLRKWNTTLALFLPTIHSTQHYLYFAALQRREETLATMPSSEIEKVEFVNWFNRLSEHKGPNHHVLMY